MIRYSNQQTLHFTISGNSFITPETFIKLVLIEEAGNYLPYFELVFLTQDIDFLKTLTSEIVLKATVGISEDKTIDTLLVILEKSFTKQGESFLVNLKGIYNNTDYISKSKISSYRDFSVNVIKQVAGQSFQQVEVTNKTSSDKQVWIQYSIPDRKFLLELWLYSYYPDDLLLIGITSFGKFKAVTVKDILSSEGWKGYLLQKDSFKGNEFLVGSDILVKSDTGFLNKIISTDNLSIDIDNNSYNEFTVSKKPILGITTEEDNPFSNKLTQVALHNANTHPNYELAYRKNLEYLLFLQRVKLEIQYTGYFKEHEILDKVDIVDSTPNKISFNDLYNGSYIIQKISRTFTNKSISTHLTLVRDTLNLEQQ